MPLFNVLVILLSTVDSCMADRVFGIRSALCLNTLVLSIVYTALSIPGLRIPGYAFSMEFLPLDNMISSKMLDSLTGKVYARDDKRHNGASAITYVISNIDTMIPGVMGTIALISGYHAVSALHTVMSTPGPILYPTLGRMMFGPIGAEPDDPPPPKTQKTTIVAMLGIIAAVTVALVLPFT